MAAGDIFVAREIAMAAVKRAHFEKLAMASMRQYLLKIGRGRGSLLMPLSTTQAHRPL